ncbi:hypothetical protein BGZ57DRAFT_78650 [Hyaloscypha finlandica]|nr:hypothetical protein BGZ57DRAFT_78650 [Hyaloscypha finlandica]
MTCYYPDGQPGEGLIPCNTTAIVSHCCRAGDLCVKNGYCFSTGLSALVRRGCTDQKFNGTVGCPQQCTIGDKFRGDVVLTPCDAPYIFACGTDQAARNSCTSGNGSFSIQAGSAGALIGTSPDAPSITISSTITATATSTTAATDCGSEKTTIIGVGAGLGVGFGIAAIAAAVFFWQWRRAEREIMRRRRQFEDPANSNEL